MAPQEYRRGQEAESARIEQPAARLLRHRHTSVPSHGELDDITVAAEPAARKLQVGWEDEQRQGSRRQCRLRADARFRHRASPQLRAVLGCEAVDATNLSQPADAVHLDVPNFWPVQ